MKQIQRKDEKNINLLYKPEAIGAAHRWFGLINCCRMKACKEYTQIVMWQVYKTHVGTNRASSETLIPKATNLIS